MNIMEDVGRDVAVPPKEGRVVTRRSTRLKGGIIAEKDQKPSDEEEKKQSDDLLSNEEEKNQNPSNGVVQKRQQQQNSAPFHLLMVSTPENSSTENIVEPMLLHDRKLRRDYLSRRYRAYRDAPPNVDLSTSDAASNPMNEPSNQALSSCLETPLWSGASFLERALVNCCELPPLRKEEANSNTEEAEVSGGSLARGYEAKFAGILAKHCHNFPSRVLALAILERTLEQDQRESLEKNGDDDASSSQLEDGQDEESDNAVYKKDNGEPAESENEEDGEEWDPERSRKRPRRSRRVKRKQGGTRQQSKRSRNNMADVDKEGAKPSKRDTTNEVDENNDSKKLKRGAETKQATKEKLSVDTELSTKEDDDLQYSKRMITFFEAGGLKILRGWLVDAVTPVSPFLSNEAQEKAEKSIEKTVPSQYGPMLLPLLELLSDIPFDKRLIVESKINKQIRRLSKQVDGLMDTFQKSKGKDKDVDSFVDPDAAVGGCVVVRVQEVLNNLKETWEKHAKNSALNQQEASNVQDPFESVKTKLRDRLKSLQDAKAGKVEKPGWLEKCEAIQTDWQKKRPRKEMNEEAEKQESTEQLALREREAERAALQDKLKAAQEERKAHLERLKNQINKRIGINVKEGTAKRKNNNGKSVQWKDGLTTDKIRKREVLEEVHVVKYAEGETAQDEEEDDESIRKEEMQPKLGQTIFRAPQDDFGLFEVDETLLL